MRKLLVWRDGPFKLDFWRCGESPPSVDQQNSGGAREDQELAHPKVFRFKSLSKEPTTATALKGAGNASRPATTAPKGAVSPEQPRRQRMQQ
jgi:hypothetical protein